MNHARAHKKILTVHQVDSIAHYKRAVVHYLERMGLTPETASAHLYESRAERARGWLGESMHAALVALESGSYVLCLRCTLQVVEYCGWSNAAWPSPTMADAYIFLRNTLEDALPIEASRKAG